MAMLKLILPGVSFRPCSSSSACGSLTTFRVPLVQTVLTLFLFEIGAIALQQLIAHEFAKAQGLGALTTYTPWTLFSVAMTVAILIFEAVLIRGVSQGLASVATPWSRTLDSSAPRVDTNVDRHQPSFASPITSRWNGG